RLIFARQVFIQQVDHLLTRNAQAVSDVSFGHKFKLVKVNLLNSTGHTTRNSSKNSKPIGEEQRHSAAESRNLRICAVSRQEKSLANVRIKDGTERAKNGLNDRRPVRRSKRKAEYGNIVAHHFDIAGFGRGACVALQPQLGLLSEQRTGSV